MAIWDSFLTERDRATFIGSGYGKRAGFGARPVVVVIDVTYRFIGDRPEPVHESTKRWRSSCGEEGWAAAAGIRTLLEAARRKGLPIVYTIGDDPRPDGWGSGRLGDKNARRSADTPEHRSLGNTIPPMIAPQPSDIVIKKNKPSAFFGTLLAAYLVDLQADSLILCGTVTSGCVRATAVDAFSYNYRTSVVEECTADRCQASHAINLFDLHMKYTDVVSLGETVDFIDGLEAGLFEDRKPSMPRDDIVAASSG